MSDTASPRPLALIVLAAGQGTRMNSDLPKPLHRLGGVPLIAHALSAGAALEPARIVVVTGHGAEAVETAVANLAPWAVSVRQTEQLVRRLLGGEEKKEPADQPSPEARELERRFREALSTKVSLKRKGKGGRLVIFFYSEEELAAIYDHIVGD